MVRVPRMVPFLASGALLGVIVGVALVLWGDHEGRQGSTAQDLILMGVSFGLVGGLLGGAVYLVAEWRARR